MVPGNAVKRHPMIEQRIRAVAACAETFPFNRIEPGDRAWASSPAAWPISTPGRSSRGLAAAAGHDLAAAGAADPQICGVGDRLIVIEELDPFIEEAVRLLGIPCEGKSIFPLIGELDPRVVRECAIEAGLLPDSAQVALTEVDVGRCPRARRCSAPAARTAAPSTC